MHFPCLIVGPDPDGQLAPLGEHITVAPYKDFLDTQDIKLMAESFSIPESDLAALAARMPEWSEVEAVPIHPTGWRKLIGRKVIERADQARKSEVQPEPLLADPPTAVLLTGVWHECPLTSDAAVVEHWRRQFGSLFDSIPGDALLTIMDIHS